ncbi:MAG: ribonuclease HII [Anaerolineae bacterium]|nr:ribonuclease HII [Anaerolineae bacterium]
MTASADLRHEYALAGRGFARVAGLDEAGRGAWAGPVVAGAVILPLDRFDLAHALRGVNDSKQLTPAEREALLPLIAGTALAVGVGYATQGEIDALGIVPATRQAMQRALDALAAAPDALLVDGRALSAFTLPCLAMDKGDQQSLSIAAASIVAKVTRDRFMDSLDDLFPQYGFREHKGYGTPLHQGALRAFGPCAAHRLTFAPLRALLSAATAAREQPAP